MNFSGVPDHQPDRPVEGRSEVLGRDQSRSTVLPDYLQPGVPVARVTQ